jgi:HK97 family phage major capsid protein
MAASNLKRLQERAAAVAERMKELAAIEERSADQTKELISLGTQSDELKSSLEFEARIAAKEAELRAMVDKSAPAGTVAPPAPAAGEQAPAKDEGKKLEIRGLMPHHTSLRAFNDGPEAVESAYRCGRWLRAAMFKNADDIRWCKDHGVESRALNEGSNSAGGALVPEEFAARVIRLVENYGTFAASNVEKVTMTRDTMIIPKRVTGTTAYFVGEGTAVSESEPTYANVQLIAKKLACGTRMSSEVVEDALVSIADSCALEFGTSLAYKQDLCGWLGDGTSTYGGIYGIVPKINDGTHTASVVGAGSGATGFETLTVTDFIKTIGKMPLYARQGAEWYISPAGFAASMARLRYAAGGNTVEQVGGGVTEQFLGYKVNLVHVMDTTLGADPSKVKVLFANLGLSSIYARRRDFSVRLFDQVYATTDQLLLQGTMRFDIVHHSLFDNTTPGPVIALKTAAS